LNPKRAAKVKKNSPVDCFLVSMCADGYRMLKALGRQAGQIAKGKVRPATQTKIGNPLMKIGGFLILYYSLFIIKYSSFILNGFP